MDFRPHSATSTRLCSDWEWPERLQLAVSWMQGAGLMLELLSWAVTAGTARLWVVCVCFSCCSLSLSLSRRQAKSRSDGSNSGSFKLPLRNA